MYASFCAVDDDSCIRVAFNQELEQYQCCWITNGQLCNAPILRRDVPNHLRSVHRANGSRKRFECKWDNCGDRLSWGRLVRHVQEVHLEHRWPCPKCGTTFTRRGVMNEHYATCDDNADEADYPFASRLFYGLG